MSVNDTCAHRYGVKVRINFTNVYLKYSQIISLNQKTLTMCMQGES